MGSGLTFGAHSECMRSCRWSFKASRLTTLHSQFLHARSYLVLMVAWLRYLRPLDWAKNSSCETSPTMRSKIAESYT